MHDCQLLDDYVKRNSQAAFQTLVSRHLDLVRACAMRQVRDVPLAEEVTQAVFILLARKAGKLRRSKKLPLAAWLHRTTCFVAATASRGELRRRQREQEAFQMQQLSSGEDTWRHIAPLLDEGIERLDATSRDAVILRYLQDEPLRNVGKILGISEEAARKRVDRSLEKLRAFFIRRGFTISAAALAGTLAGQKAIAAPAGLAANIGTTAMQHAGAAAAALPGLAAETLQAWRWAMMKLVAGFGVAVAVVILLTTSAWMGKERQRADGQSAKNDSNEAMALPATNDRSIVAKTRGAQPQYFELRVVDAQTGRGIPQATVLVKSSRYIKQMQPDVLAPLQTDSEGRCNIRLPYANPAMLMAGVVADGYEERTLTEKGDAIFPASHIMRLLPGATIGGVVVDDAGRPVAGACVRHYFSYASDGPNAESQKECGGTSSFEGDTAITDSTGHWTFRSAPTRVGISVNGVVVTHPDFPMASACFACADNELELNEEKLYAGKAVYTLRKGLTLAGMVTDEFGFYIANANVEHTSGRNIATATDGSFFLRVLPKSVNYLTVTAEGFAPWQIEVPNVPDIAPLDVKLNRGAVLRIRVLDAAGAPAPGAYLECRLRAVRWSGTADADGRVVWEHALLEPMSLNATPKGHTPTGENTVNLTVTADGEEHVVTLAAPQIVAGRAGGVK